VVVATTPRPIAIIKALVADPGFVVTRGSTYENIHNLPDPFIKRVVKQYEGTRLGRQELHAEILEDDPRALWNRETIEGLRVVEAPELVRVVVGVDPPGGATECGIVAGGIGLDGNAYILDDRSLQASPNTWGREVVTCYHRNQADRVLGEANFGGDMVETIIRTIDPSIAYKAVRLSPTRPYTPAGARRRGPSRWRACTSKSGCTTSGRCPAWKMRCVPGCPG